MTAHRGTISGSAAFELCTDEGPTFEVDCGLHYDPHDPFAVLAHFQLGDQQVRWVFARSLLTDGLDAPAGLGDVHVHPGTDSQGQACVYIDLIAPGNTARMRTRAADVRAFLESTYRAVPAGDESRWLDVDAELASVLPD